MLRTGATSNDFIRSVDASYTLDWISVDGIFLSLAIFVISGFVYRSQKKIGASSWLMQTVLFISLSSFFLILAVSLVFFGKIERAATEEIYAVLDQTPKSISVDGTIISESLPLLNALRNMQEHDHPGNHEQPLPRIYTLVVETATTRLELQLRRYAFHPHEYVVLYPAYRRTRISPVGHIATDALDGTPG